ncbi:Probable low-affinity inorganic phosphate transporter [Micrococcus lylae]|uniref:Probable low-affinity inorganic phosphate transporter n=1 Tax=Micrococcus lylae TaxID=1273 RepID=A0A1R4IRL7_9MICC|nr:inorganic phosphate transporter [Micrococcus lylae]SJN22324.1 Probable low-affinity inorganic phosphate transporter [Micrococcus lylae]
MLLGLTLSFVAICGLGVLTGFRDAPNSVALAVRFRSLSPRISLQLTAAMKALGVLFGTTLMTFYAAFFLHPETNGWPGLATTGIAILVTIGWGLLMWWRRIPGSTTHSLISALWGTTIAAHLTVGSDQIEQVVSFVQWELLVGLLISPLIAWAFARLLTRPLLRLGTTGSTVRVQHRARLALAISTSASAFGHGMQTGQRMGILWALVLASAGARELAALPPAQLWACAGAFALATAIGTLGGAWRISWTLTERLVSLDPLRASVAAGTAAAWLFFGTLLLHMPMSSTHMTVASIVGAGQDQTFASVRWGQLARVFLWWLATPAVCLVLSFILAGGVLVLA